MTCTRTCKPSPTCCSILFPGRVLRQRRASPPSIAGYRARTVWRHVESKHHPWEPEAGTGLNRMDEVAGLEQGVHILRSTLSASEGCARNARRVGESRPAGTSRSALRRRSGAGAAAWRVVLRAYISARANQTTGVAATIETALAVARPSERRDPDRIIPLFRDVEDSHGTRSLRRSRRARQPRRQ